MDPDLWLIGAVFAAAFGACVGSFLNVCIHRIPQDLSVVRPRSFCMSCRQPIPWYFNLPVVSYFVLRGRCRNCKAPFSFRYAFIELLTAWLFVMACVAYPPAGTEPLFGIVRLPSLAAVPVVWLVVSGLVVATFVDFDHFIIPDSVTIGGTAAGIVLSALVPSLHGAAGPVGGLLHAVLGAAVGFAVLFAVAELGKKAFGRKRVVLEEPVVLQVTACDPEGVDLLLDGERVEWAELFGRPSDRWVFDCAEASLGERAWGATRVVLDLEGLAIGEERLAPGDGGGFRARVTGYVQPREAMGFGDVKFMAAIGAFLGWRAVLFTVVASSLFGTVVGLVLIALGRRRMGSRIPFGPYIALGALVWIFWGPRLIDAYLGLLTPAAMWVAGGR